MHMDIHYNAFISYRHHPDDIRAATQIHRALERFRVPKALRKSVKLPLRLFRDKDELPITSNLSDDIFSALRNSDFLIVICSVHTKESMWVQREIETFLQTHSRSQVLTVLVSGEPYEVIPEILLYEDRVDPVTGEVTKIPMEPLSCDWRIGQRKARREELPRLAAALLHCGYDELRQRQRQYRTRQLITFFSIALTFSLCLAAYFLYTSITIRNANIQIQENLDQALRNQSQHLTTAAQELLEEGDRMSALSLLLEALPREDAPRPYVADAEYVLSEALGVYSQKNTLTASAALIPNASAEVFSFKVSYKEDVIYLYDSRSIITAWDTYTLLQLGTITPPGACELLATTAESNILVQAQDASGLLLQCYDPQGTLLWQLPKFTAHALSWDDTVVYALTRDSSAGSQLHILNSLTGKPIRKPISLRDMPDGSYPVRFCHDFIDGTLPIPMVFANEDYQTCLVSPETGTVLSLVRSETSPECSRVTDDGMVLFMISDGSGQYNGTVGPLTTTSPKRSDIYCFDLHTGQLIWQSEIETCQYTTERLIYPVPDSSWILCQTGNTLQLLDRQTGNLVQRCDTTNSIVRMLSVHPTYAFGFLDNGSVFSYRYSGNYCDIVDYNMEGNLKDADSGGNFYTLAADSAQVTVYNFMTSHTDWQVYLDQELYSEDLRQFGNRLAFSTLEESICLLDLETKQLLWEIPVPSSSILDFSSDGTTLWVLSDYSTLIAIDTQSGQHSQYEIPETVEGNPAIQITKPKLIEGRFWYLLSYGQTLYLCSYDPETDSAELYETVHTATGDISPKLAAFANNAMALNILLNQAQDGYSEEELEQITKLANSLPQFLLLSEEAKILTVQGNFAWVLTGTGDLYELDLTDCTSTLRVSGLSGLPGYAFRGSDNAIAITAGQEIQIFTPGGEEIQKITLNAEKPACLYFHDDALLALCDSGYLLRFDAEGNQLSRTGLTVSESYSTQLFSDLSPADITWQFTPQGQLILNAFQVCNCIETDGWAVTAFVTDCLAYNSMEEEFIVQKEDSLVSYPHYTTQELIDLTHEVLGSYTLSQERREAYGIG